MNSFTVRIELHSDIYSDFASLHSQMERKGFSRLITSDSGTTYHLPRAEYDIYTSEPRSSVLNRAKEAVSAIGKTAEILVTESAGRTWHGLKEAK